MSIARTWRLLRGATGPPAARAALRRGRGGSRPPGPGRAGPRAQPGRPGTQPGSRCREPASGRGVTQPGRPGTQPGSRPRAFLRSAPARRQPAPRCPALFSARPCPAAPLSEWAANMDGGPSKAPWRCPSGAGATSGPRHRIPRANRSDPLPPPASVGPPPGARAGGATDTQHVPHGTRTGALPARAVSPWFNRR